MLALSASWPVLHIQQQRSCALLGRLILLQSLLLYFPCTTPATPIAQDHLFLNVLSVCRMARPPYSSPVQSPVGFITFIHLILL